METLLGLQALIFLLLAVQDSVTGLSGTSLWLSLPGPSPWLGGLPAWKEKGMDGEKASDRRGRKAEAWTKAWRQENASHI